MRLDRSTLHVEREVSHYMLRTYRRLHCHHHLQVCVVQLQLHVHHCDASLDHQSRTAGELQQHHQDFSQMSVFLLQRVITVGS